MSGIYAVLFPHEDTAFTGQLDRLVQFSARRGKSGTKSATFSRDGFTLMRPGEKLYRREGSGAMYSEYLGLIGCAYSRPIALAENDAGPFFVKPDANVAIAYDGIVSGYTGSQLAEWLDTNDAESNWADLVDRLDGQFALIALCRKQPQRIYYAVKAKPLYLLVDSLGRGIMVASSPEAFQTMYHPTRSSRPVELKPYTAGHISIEGIVYERRSLIRFPGDGTLVLSGGGLDTLVAAWDTKRRFPNERMCLIYFDYGAKAHWREHYATEAIAVAIRKRYRNSRTTAELYEFPLLAEIAASSLTDLRRSVNIAPRPGKASEWVPARNTVLLTLALAIAESGGWSRIVTGINQDAAAAYPDNDPEWLDRLQKVVPYALGTDRTVKLEAPLGMMSKIEIVKHGDESCKIPWSEAPSWSCYNGGEYHCGLCSSCRARRKAFMLAGVNDVTVYSDDL